MTVIQIAPDLHRAAVRVEAIMQLPADLAKAKCWCSLGHCYGFCIDDLPLEFWGLELRFRQQTDKWFARMAIRGYEPLGTDVRVHGPFMSKEFLQRMENPNNPDFTAAKRQDQNGDVHPELVLPYVYDRPAESPYRDYVLVHQFIKQAELTEVIINEPATA